MRNESTTLKPLVTLARHLRWTIRPCQLPIISYIHVIFLACHLRTTETRLPDAPSLSSRRYRLRFLLFLSIRGEIDVSNWTGM
jgi:hypothetical protein